MIGSYPLLKKNILLVYPMIFLKNYSTTAKQVFLKKIKTIGKIKHLKVHSSHIRPQKQQLRIITKS